MRPDAAASDSGHLMTSPHGARRAADGGLPCISVVIATYNAAASLDQCLDSLKSQTAPSERYEVLVMDGGSTDGTTEILSRRQGDLAHWESSPDRGIAHAWNKAIPHCLGTWVLFVGADDVLADEHVLARAEYLLGGRGELVCHGRIRMIGGRWNGASFGSPKSAAKLKHRMAVPHQATFHRRSLFDIHGGFTESYRISSDYELLLRPAIRESMAYIDLEVTHMAAGGVSSTDVPHALTEAFRAQRLHKSAPLTVLTSYLLYYRVRHASARWRR